MPEANENPKDGSQNNPSSQKCNSGGNQGEGGKRTRKRSGIIAICTTVGGILVTAATGLLAKIGLHSLAIWTFFAGASTILLGLNLTLRAFWFKHKGSWKIVGGLGLPTPPGIFSRRRNHGPQCRIQLRDNLRREGRQSSLPSPQKGLWLMVYSLWNPKPPSCPVRRTSLLPSLPPADYQDCSCLREDCRATQQSQRLTP